MSKKVSAIVASVIDPATSKASAEAAMKAGIPFILQGQEPTDVDWATGNVGYSEADMGRLAGEEVADCLNQKYKSAAAIKVGACGWPQWPSTVRRINASKAAVEKGTGKKISWVFEQKCGTREKGDSVVSAALQANPDLRAVVSINDGSDMGAIAAFEAAGVKPAELVLPGPTMISRCGSMWPTDRYTEPSISIIAALPRRPWISSWTPPPAKKIPKMSYVDMIKVTKDNVSKWPVK